MVTEHYVDNDISASTKTRKARPEYGRLREDAERGHIDGILVYSMDRLTRRMSELVEFIEWRERVGIPFMSTEGDDTETANGRMVIQIKGAVAQQESERISERVKRSRQQSRAAGKPVSGGTRPFGWTTHRRTELEPREADAIRHGCKLVLNGGTKGDWIRWMEAEGIPTVRGGQWQYHSALGILRSPSIAGLMAQENGTYGTAVGYVPIVSPAEWHELQGRIGKAGNVTHAVRSHLYAGLVHCGRCGARMVAQVAPSRRRWACATHVAGGCNKVFRDYDRLNATVTAVVDEMLQRIPDLSGEEGAGELDALAKRIAGIEEDIADARRAWRDGELAREDFYAVTAELRAEVNDLKQRQVGAAQMAAHALEGSALSVWREAAPETFHLRRAIAVKLIERVVVHPVGKGVRGQAAVAPEGLDIVPR